MHVAAWFSCARLHSVFTAECCLQLFLQIALLRVNSIGQSSAEIYCTQFGAHVFDAHRLDAQCCATLLYYTIAIQLHYYSDYTSATLLHDCHSTATLLPLSVAATLRLLYCHSTATLLPFYCHSTATFTPLHCNSIATLLCHSSATLIPLHCHCYSPATLLPLFCHSTAILLPLYCHSTTTLGPLHWHSTATHQQPGTTAAQIFPNPTQPR